MTTYGISGRTIIVEETRYTSFLEFLADGVVSLASTDVLWRGRARQGI